MDSSMVLGVFRNAMNKSVAVGTEMDMDEIDTIFQVSTTTTTSPATTTSAPDHSVSMDKFYPALVQCFGIIICGYLAGRFKIITNSETKGLGTFVSNFALPSLIFLSLVELNWDSVNWTFLVAVAISKTAVFLAVIVISLLITRPLNFARAGLLGVFTTQSNDFAIGYPILEALYKDVHPEYPSYLYLLAPISLAVLNPISMVLLEVNKIRQSKTEPAPESAICVDSCPAEQLTKRTRCLGEKQLVLLNMLQSLFLNPTILMTVFGICGAFVFPNGLPEIIASGLRIFGQSFSATALFLLGLKIVGKGGSLRGSGFLIPGILTLVKVLVLPLVSRQTVNIMQAGTDFNDTTELSTFAFFYGTFPTAPGAFVFATQYSVDADLMATSMVLCTFISAPIMFISAKMISLTNLNPVNYIHELDNFSFDISVAGIAGCVWVLLLLIVTKRFKGMTQRITFCLVLSQLMSCLAMIIWAEFDQVEKWVIYLQFFLFNMGSFSSRLWTATLAIALLFLQCRSLCFVLKLWPYMIGISWGVPAFISALLIALDNKIISANNHSPCFQYGTAQAAVTVFLLVMCFFVTVGCLVMHQRYKKRFEKYLTYTRELSHPDSEPPELQSSVSTANLLSNADGARLTNGSVPTQRRRFRTYSSSDDDDVISTADNGASTIAIGCGNSNDNCCTTTNTPATTTVVLDIEDLLVRRQAAVNSAGEGVPRRRSVEAATASSTNQFDDENLGIGAAICNPSFSCGAGSSHQNCQSLIDRYRDQSRVGLEPLEHTSDADEYQILKHTVLLILLLCSMFVGLSVSIWTLVMDGMSGIYLELSFLDAFLNFGQSLIVLAVFISDTSELLRPLIVIWRKLWYGANVLKLPQFSNLSPETKHTCEQFRNHHLENCKKDIAKDRRWRIKIYHKVFYGTEFVDWLIQMGLSEDRLEAVHYARHLVDGRVLRHINNVYHFEDKQLLYNFCARM